MTQTSRAVKAEAELAAMTLGAVAGPSLARDTPDDMAALAVGLYVGVFVSRSPLSLPQPVRPQFVDGTLLSPPLLIIVTQPPRVVRQSIILCDTFHSCASRCHSNAERPPQLAPGGHRHVAGAAEHPAVDGPGTGANTLYESTFCCVYSPGAVVNHVKHPSKTTEKSRERVKGQVTGNVPACWCLSSNRPDPRRYEIRF